MGDHVIKLELRIEEIPKGIKEALMAAWSKQVTLDIEALEDAQSILRRALAKTEERYVHYDDAELRLIYSLIEKALANVRDVRSRHYPQGRLFEEEHG